jgi:hypothetical protein
LDLNNIEARIVRDVDPERFRKITSSTLEGLAKRELNLGALLGKSAEARERRLIPEVIEDFFIAAGPVAGVHPRPVQKDGHVYRIGKLPRMLQPIGERLEPRFGRLGREYQKVVFDKALLPTDPTLEWVTPGHPLFEAVREDVAERVRDDLKRGAVFYEGVVGREGNGYYIKELPAVPASESAAMPDSITIARRTRGGDDFDGTPNAPALRHRGLA